MPSAHSIQRLARLSKRVQSDLRRGGMGITFKYLFRSTTILARISTVLAEQVASLSAEVERLQARAAVRGPEAPAATRRAATRS